MEYLSYGLYTFLILGLLYIIIYLITLIIKHNNENIILKNTLNSSQGENSDIDNIKDRDVNNPLDKNKSESLKSTDTDIGINNNILITPQDDENKCKLWIDKTKHLNISDAHEFFIDEGKKANERDGDFPIFPKYWLSPNKDKDHCKSLKENGKWLNEEYCREFMEYIFSEKFIKINPHWCKNPKTGRKLELDVYNDNLNIAIEYNGKQHYTYTPIYHKNVDCLYDQQYRDFIKKKMCLENNVYLITIPYTVKLEYIPVFIYSNLLEAFHNKY